MEEVTNMVNKMRGNKSAEREEQEIEKNRICDITPQNLEENKPSTIEEEKLCKELNKKMEHRREQLKEKYSNKKNYNYPHNNYR